MTIYLATIIILSVVLIGALIYFSTVIKNLKRDYSKKINDIKKDIELTNIRNNLSQSRVLLTDIEMKLNHLRKELEIHIEHFPDESTNVKRKYIETCEALKESRIESFLNIYETACLQYIRNPALYSFFKEDFADEISDIVESEYFKAFFNVATTRYNNIVVFYKKINYKSG